MDSNEVILSLNDAIEKLTLAIRILEQKRDNIDGTSDDANDQFLVVTAEIDRLNAKLRNLDLQRIQRKRARSLGQAVTRLSDAARKRLEDGLRALDVSVAAVADFRSALDLASEIADAADEVSGAVG